MLTNSRPAASTYSPHGPLALSWVLPLVPVTKSGCPRTPSALAPDALAAALSKRSTRLFVKSPTQSRPAASTKTPIGLLNLFAASPLVAVVKSACPSTASAAAPLTSASVLFQRSTR
ncbi:MAG: hypothetical protein U0704_10865 [Candidatus Eisenbacteria bacterium]